MKHGHARKNNRTPEYNCWKAMRARCLNTRCRAYKRYGGAGIVISTRWDNFENFYADMGPRPDGMTLDRINSKGNYEPSNCRWASYKTQGENKSSTNWVTINGETKTLTSWASIAGVSRRILRKRIAAGETGKSILSGARKPELRLGASNSKTKLTTAIVLEIRSAPSYRGRATYFARKYGVSAPTVHAILQRQTWKHV